MAYRLLAILALVFVLAGVVLRALGSFAYVPVLAIAVVFALGALLARMVRRR